MQDKRLITVNEAAQQLGLHHSAVRRAINRGELPAAKICSRIRINQDELRRWIEGQRVKAA